MINPFVVAPPTFTRGKGYWKKQYPFTFSPNWINDDLTALNNQIEILKSKSMPIKASELGKLHDSLKFWKENNATIENFFNFVAFASTVSRGDYTKFVFLDESIYEKLLSVSFPSLSSGLPVDANKLDTIKSRHERLITEVTYLRENLNEVVPRLFEMKSFPIDLFKSIPTVENRGPKFLTKVIAAIAPDVRRVNQLMETNDNVDLVLSAIIDTRSHLNIINEEKRSDKVNGVTIEDFYKEITINDSIYISKLYEIIKQALNNKYYSIPLGEGEPERLPLRLFINNIDVVFDIKTKVVNKLAPIIDANKRYFVQNPNYLNIDFKKYFTELSEMFYADDELCIDWLRQVENMVADMDAKVLLLRSKLIEANGSWQNIDSSSYEKSSLSDFESSDFTFQEVSNYHPFIVEANLLRKCKEVYKEILYYKRPLMELVITFDRLMMKELKREEYLQMMHSQLSNRLLLFEDEFKDINANDLYKESLVSNDILFPIMAPTTSVAAFMGDFFKLRKMAKESTQGTVKHRIVEYAVYKMMKTAKTYDEKKNKFIEPQLQELYDNGVEQEVVGSFIDNAEPYLPLSVEDVIEFGDKYELLPSYCLDAFIMKKFIIEDFLGVPRGVLEGYLTYLTIKLGSDERSAEVFKVISNSMINGETTFTQKNYVTNVDKIQSVSMIAAIFDPAIMKHQEVKEVYKRVGSYLRNPPSGIMTVDQYWKKVNELSKVNGIPFMKASYYPSDIARAKDGWKELKQKVTQAQEKVASDFGNEVFAYFKGYEIGGNEVASGTFAPLLNKGLA
jgi:hypothetical protein